MRIIFVVGDISATGGTERVTSEVASVLSKGHDVTVLSLFNKVENSFFDYSTRVDIVHAKIDPHCNVIVKFLKVSMAIYKFARNFNADFVVLVDSILFIFCLPFVNLVESRIITWEHFNLSTSHGSKFRVLSRFFASRFSNGIVVLTERDLLSWRSRYNLRSEIVAICNPIPRLPAIRRDKENIVLAVGRLSYEKGFDILLKSWPNVVSIYPDWKLRIVGSGTLENDLRNLANILDVSDSVEFAGKVKNIEIEYSRASIYVMTSRWEGLPMTLLEAQHFGLPSISTDCVTGPKEILSHNNGLLIDVDDYQALSEKILLLINDECLRNRFSESAKLQSKNYALPRVRKRWEQFFGLLV
ncbi:glycosyl transferase group 1 [Vibrio maritimus]|uniref:Glycosyl transferase group 1 n=1 Tax=Vibrio maritimus TaxID=990268 RepID=A0A090TFN6_9VIBR|nr:glycosyl transferase group 1 [Vibrio maritimus]